MVLTKNENNGVFNKTQEMGERRIIHYPQKRIIGLYVINMALLNYEFDRQLELERADAYAEGFLRGYKKGFEKEMRKQMVFNMYEEGYSVDLIADIVVELTKEEIEDAIEIRKK